MGPMVGKWRRRWILLALVALLAVSCSSTTDVVLGDSDSTGVAGESSDGSDSADLTKLELMAFLDGTAWFIDYATEDVFDATLSFSTGSLETESPTLYVELGSECRGAFVTIELRSDEFVVVDNTPEHGRLIQCPSDELFPARPVTLELNNSGQLLIQHGGPVIVAEHFVSESIQQDAPPVTNTTVAPPDHNDDVVDEPIATTLVVRQEECTTRNSDGTPNTTVPGEWFCAE